MLDIIVPHGKILPPKCTRIQYFQRKYFLVHIIKLQLCFKLYVSTMKQQGMFLSMSSRIYHFS